jgi:ubiquitin-protein ligase
MTPKRLQHETAVLERYFPKKFQFVNLNESNEYLDVGVKTQSGKVYRLHIRLKANYPSTLPKVYVVWPTPLTDYFGDPMKSTSHDMHTLSSDGSFVQICHFKKENWTPIQSLYKIVMKSRIWLEAYEGHLRTGRPIDVFLNS